MKTFKLFAVTTALVASSLACAVPAAAETTTTTVKYSDLDLNSPTGAAALYSRLKIAAWRVCRDADSRVAPLQISTCIHEALESAVKEVNRPNLTALHEGRASAGLTAQR